MIFAKNSSSLDSPLIREVITRLEKQGLQVGKKIGEGLEGEIYALQNNKTRKITHVLKVSFCLGKKFNPQKGSHLLANVQHRNICSPMQFFYASKTGCVTTTPEAGSICLASIMPYIDGSRLMDVQAEMSKEARQIFHFGLLLCQAVQALVKHNISHEDLHDANILVDKEFNPFIIDFDLANTTSFVSKKDYSQVQLHLTKMIKNSTDFNTKSKQFLLHCLTKCDPFSGQVTDESQLPSLMVSFMQACIDHLSEIKPTSAPPVSKL